MSNNGCGMQVAGCFISLLGMALLGIAALAAMAAAV